jgi:ferredoxin
MPTPFGIRRRIKRLFGLEQSNAPAEPEVPKVELLIVAPDGSEQKCSAAAGSSILGVSANAKRPISSGCADSSCGTCRVEVLEGAENLSAQAPRERATLKQSGHPMTLRLACTTSLDRGSAKVKAFELM